MFYATQPNTTYTITCQSLNPGPNGTNVDIFVQSILYSSLPHPDANGYTWESAQDSLTGNDNVTLTTPGSYNTPYNVTYWIAAFGQRAGTYTMNLATGAASSGSGTSTSSSSSGLSGGDIAGIVIGSVVGAAILLAVCVLLLFKFASADTDKQKQHSAAGKQVPAQRFEDASQLGSHVDMSQREVEMSQNTA